MRRSRTLSLLLAAVAALSSTAAAQQPPAGARPAPGQGMPQAPGTIVGRVQGEGGRPLSSASISVRAMRDSALVGGALASQDGAFRVQGLTPGRYRVRVRSIGHAAIIREIAITPAEPRVDMGIVTLSPIATELEGITASAEQEEAVMAPDRNAYRVRDMPAAAGGTTVDVLRNVPGVEVDADNKVSLRGNQNVVIQINGRATPMRGEQLGNFLAQLPSNLVQSVEVVPNPSARNDPDGMAGILNIVLKQNTDLGTSAGLTLATGTTGMINTSGNVGHQQGPWTLFASYGFFRDRREMNGYSNRHNLYTTPNTYLDADNLGRMRPLGHNATAQVEYKIDTRNSLSSNLMFNDRNFSRSLENLYVQMDENRNVTGRYDRTTDAESADNLFDWSGAFRRVLQPQRNEFSTEFRVNRSTTDFLSQYTDQPRNPDGSPASSQPGLQQDHLDEARTEFTLQADVTRPIGQRGKFEFGYKGVHRDLDNDFAASSYDYDQSRYVDDAARSNAFTYRDFVNAVYAVVSNSVGRLNMQAGLRAEQANRTFSLASSTQDYDNQYRSLYPSALLSFDMTPTRQVKASYSRRVQRPDTRQLNPFVFREDALNAFQGNPDLAPEYTDALELGYQQAFGKGSVQVSPFFRHTTGAVRQIRTVDGDGVSRVTFANLATADSYGADVNGSLRVGNFNAFGGFNVFRSVSDASNLSTDVSSDAIGWGARMNGSYKLRPSLDAMTFAMYRAPMNTEQGRIASHSMLGLALRQRVMADKGSVTVRVQDPFNTMRFGFRMNDGRVDQNTLRRFGARGLFVNFSYNYGQQPRLRNRPQEQQPDTQAPPSTMGPPSGN